MPDELTVIGCTAIVNFPEQGISGVPARIDTGAKTSAVWTSNVKEDNGRLSFTMFAETSDFYNGGVISTDEYELKKIRSTIGAVEKGIQ